MHKFLYISARTVVDPDQKHFRSLITFWDVMEPDTMPSQASVPVMKNSFFVNSLFTWKGSLEFAEGNRIGSQLFGQILERYKNSFVNLLSLIEYFFLLLIKDYPYF